jgi:hypothetical protein
MESRMKKIIGFILIFAFIFALSACTGEQTVTTEAQTTVPQTTEVITTVPQTTEEQTTVETTTEEQTTEEIIHIEGIPDDLTFLFPDGADGYIIDNFGMICIGRDDGTADDGKKFAELLIEHGFAEKTRKEEKDDMGYDGFFGQYESEKYSVNIIVNSVQMHRLSMDITARS